MQNSTPLSLIFIFTLFWVGSFANAQETAEDSDILSLEVIFDQSWNHQIKGETFENQRTAPVLVVDEDENVFISGCFTDRLKVSEDKVFSSRGSTDIFLIKYSKTGKLLWAKQAGGVGKDYVASLHLSHDGGVILSGHFEDSTSFDRIKANIPKGGYVASYNQQGTVMWVKTENKTLYAIPHTDRQGSFYLSEAYKDKISIDSMEIANPTRYYNSYLAKFDSNDKLEWMSIINQMGMRGRGEVKTSGMMVDEEGNIFLGGTFLYAPVFDNTQIRSGKREDIFLAKYNPEGTMIWVLQLTNSDNKYEVDKVFMDNNDNICIRATAFDISDTDTLRTFHQFEYNEHATSVSYHTFFGWEPGEDITSDTLNYQYSRFVQTKDKRRVYKIGVVGNILHVSKFARRTLQATARKED